MALCNIIDKLHDEHGLSYTSTTEESNLSSLHVRLKEVNDFNTRVEHFAAGLQVFKFRCFTMDRISSRLFV